MISLLKTAHQMRYKVALVTLQGREAALTVPPTASVELAKRKMAAMRPAGGTPLAAGLRLAVRTIHNEELKEPDIQPILLIVSDGEATVALGRDGDPQLELMRIAEKIGRRESFRCICLDSKERPPHARGKSEMMSLSELLGGSYVHRDYLKSSRTGENTSETRT